MGELLPAVGALPSFDLEEAGGFVAGLLSSEALARSVVDAISEIAAGLTWDRTAAGYLDVYERALARPRRAVSDTLRATSRGGAGTSATVGGALRVAVDSGAACRRRDEQSCAAGRAGSRPGRCALSRSGSGRASSARGARRAP